MKKIFYLLLGIVGCNTISVSAMETNLNTYFYNYNGVEITETEYSNLESLGFTDNEIMYMSQTEFNDNKDLKGEVVSEITTYVKVINGIEQVVSKEEYEAPDMSIFGMQAGYIETGAKKMTTRIISTNGRYRYKVDLEWKSMPKVRSYDILGIGIENNVSIYSNVYFQQNYCYSSGRCSSSTTSSKKSTSTGGAASFKIPSSTLLTSLSSYLYFNVDKKSSMTITELNAYGDYSHATKTISESNAKNYSITRAGIVLQDSIASYYDAISYAQAVWTGSW